jgi:hypothetical protein
MLIYKCTIRLIQFRKYFILYRMDQHESNTNIQIIMRQTDYTYEEAKNKLELYNNNIKEVIRSYLRPDISSQSPEIKPQLSMNQQIYKEIRGLMDDIEVCKRM